MRVGLRGFLLIVTLGSLIAASLAMRSRSTTMQSTLDYAVEADRLRTQARVARAHAEEIEGQFRRMAPAPLAADWAAGCTLQILPTSDNRAEIPLEGRRLVLIGDINEGIWIRVFDDEGRRVVDMPPGFFVYHTPIGTRVNALRVRLSQLAPPHIPTEAERAEVLAETASIVNTCRPIAAEYLATYRERTKAEHARMIAEAERLEALSRP